jgi:hypothetical protein
MVDGDGVEELLGGVKRVAVTAAGQMLENAARAREAELRRRADADRAAAWSDAARVQALLEVEVAAQRDAPTAVAVLAADTRRAALDRVEPEVAEAVAVAGRNQARPAVEAVTATPAATARKAPRRGRAAERVAER